MAKELAAPLQLTVAFDYTNTDEINPSRGFTFTFEDALANGTGVGEADLLWSDRRTLVGASEELDLAAVLKDIFQDTLTFVKVKGIIIRNRATTSGFILAVGGAAANQFVNWVANASDILNIGPGGLFADWSPIDGFAVTAGSGDKLKIDSGANTITYDIMLFGTSA